jgi:hypothetical protein
MGKAAAISPLEADFPTLRVRFVCWLFSLEAKVQSAQAGLASDSPQLWRQTIAKESCGRVSVKLV